MASRLNLAIRPLHCLLRTPMARPMQPRSGLSGPVLSFTRSNQNANLKGPRSALKKLVKSAKKAANVKHFGVSEEAKARIPRTLWLNHIPKEISHSELKTWCQEHGVHP